SEFISPDDFDLQKPILEYTHLCEKFVNEQFDAHAGEHPDLKVSLITGMPVERVSTWFASPDERARFREEVLELHEGGIQTPYGTSLAPSQEKTTEEAK
ncbi:MAG TPA: hypothetical protein DEP87_00235, partial [Candidatus Pacebacteria bacterium]|nr:hypothetical protein [Candidatus Paceibacterota bacterium]